MTVIDPMTDPRVDSEKFMFEGMDTSEKPVFTISEMVKFFFARTNHWIRWLEANGRMATVVNPDKDCAECDGRRVVVVETPDGKKKIDGACPACTVPVGTRRKEPGKGRIYTLSDIEEIAHALAANGAIDGTKLRHILLLLRVQGEMNDYL